MKYCIVNECGASIWSVTKEAEKEFPNIPPVIRSAIAIARRVQDPLLEYSKIEAKHLGVGMYQHDLPQKELQEVFDSIVEECVSFVGVDLNVCSETILSKISGLTASTAKNIIEFRKRNGAFYNRQELLQVEGITPKIYQQVAGFVKIIPETVFPRYTNGDVSSRKKQRTGDRINPLDRTIIHPESYDIAEKFLKELKSSPEEIGTSTLAHKVKSYTTFKSMKSIANMYNTSIPVMNLISVALQQTNEDIRYELEMPLFSTNVKKFSELKSQQVVSGRVTSLTSFGVFIDIGLTKDGLLHESKLEGELLYVGKRVFVKVIHLDDKRCRIDLELMQHINSE